MNPDALLDAEAAAVAIGVTARTIQLYVASGRLKNYGTARRILVKFADLQDFV